MPFEQTEGVILRSWDFQDEDQIFSVFSRDYGILKLIAKGRYQKKCRSHMRIVPLTRGELVFRFGKGELARCVEFSVLDSSLGLRKEWRHLTAAAELVQTLQHALLVGKPAPKLYHLFCSYLKNLPHFLDNEVAISSFRLKVLKHEGVLGISRHCARCRDFLSLCWIFRGESYCSQHAPKEAFSLSEEELKEIAFLADCRLFSRLTKENLKVEVGEKTRLFFHDRL